MAHGLAPKATSALFLQNNNIQTWLQSEFLVSQLNTVYFGQNSIRYLGPIIWNSLLLTFRNNESSSECKFLIKNWKPISCPYMFCENDSPNIGFVNVTH